jgi:hypothetical protein
MNSLGLLIKKIITLDEFEEQLQLSLFEEFINFTESAKTIRDVRKWFEQNRKK